MGWRRVHGALGPVRERSMPVIPSRWRFPAVALTVIVCAGLFVAAVVVGLHG